MVTSACLPAATRRPRVSGSNSSPTTNPGLTDVAGWESMSVTEAAQAVQVSAYPDAYAQWETLAREAVESEG